LETQLVSGADSEHRPVVYFALGKLRMTLFKQMWERGETNEQNTLGGQTFNSFKEFLGRR